MIYLDNAATSYKKPDCVLRAVFNATLKNSANAGRGGYKEAVESSEILYKFEHTVLKKKLNFERNELIL